jgi:hypothetical protein
MEFGRIYGGTIMNSAKNIHLSNSTFITPPHKASSVMALKFTAKNERKILKAFLLGQLHDLFCEIFHCKVDDIKNNFSMECYSMDTKIIQILIQGIVETGEYTLEGIAYYTRIPFDVIYDVACGKGNEFTITPWARVVDLYLKLKPDVAKVLVNRFLEIKDKNHAALSELLNEV